MWPTTMRKHSASSLGTRLGPWLCLNIVPDTHSEPQTCQCGNICTYHSPYIDMLHSLRWEIWHGNLSLTDGPWHTSHDNIAHVQSQRTWQTWTCTPRLQLLSKLCLMRLGLTEEFLRTFSCPPLSLHLKWPLYIRYWCVVLICYRFC